MYTLQQVGSSAAQRGMYLLDGIFAEAEINAEHFGVCSSCYNTALNRVTNPHQSIRDERLALGLSQSELVTLASMDYTFGSAMVHLSPKTIIPVISALKRLLMSASGIAGDGWGRLGTARYGPVWSGIVRNGRLTSVTVRCYTYSCVRYGQSNPMRPYMAWGGTVSVRCARTVSVKRVR